MAATWAGAGGGVSFGFGASASFGASAGCGASASAFDSTPCGAAAANRSSNESNGPDGTLAGAPITGAGSGKAARTSLVAGAPLTASVGGRLITGASKFELLSFG